MYQAFKGVPLLRFFGDNNGTMGHYPSLTIERCGLFIRSDHVTKDSTRDCLRVIHSFKVMFESERPSVVSK